MFQRRYFQLQNFNVICLRGLAIIFLFSVFFFPQSIVAQSINAGDSSALPVLLEKESTEQVCDMTAVTRSRRAAKNHSFEAFLLRKLSEARRLLSSSCPIDNNTVCISLMERNSGRIYAVTMDKVDFLTAGYQQQFLIGNNGASVTVRVDLPNYVNTKLTCESDASIFIPLTIKYPIVKGNSFKETAYYNPAHSVLADYGFSLIGDKYINKIINDAAVSLKKNGIIVPDKVQQLANLLCIVEHIDHGRYRNEEHSKLFQEVQTLFALNRGDTYRFSVSSAGAGGMVQMIAPTYREIKSAYPQIDWVDDFEEGMRNHSNAAKAMLLYLNRYYDYFLRNRSVQEALAAKLATEEEILAAGYNSNPIRVPSKLLNGENWKHHLPYETQIYLNILTSLNGSVTTGAFQPLNYRPIVRFRSKKQRASSTKVRLIKNKSAVKSSKRLISRPKSKSGSIKSKKGGSPSRANKYSKWKSTKR